MLPLRGFISSELFVSLLRYQMGARVLASAVCNQSWGIFITLLLVVVMRKFVAVTYGIGEVSFGLVITWATGLFSTNLKFNLIPVERRLETTSNMLGIT